jgi:hypothetical protein
MKTADGHHRGMSYDLPQQRGCSRQEANRTVMHTTSDATDLLSAKGTRFRSVDK